MSNPAVPQKNSTVARGGSATYESGPGQREDRRRVDTRALFLAQLSRALGDSFDYEETVAKVARLAAPELGAWCVVDLIDPAGAMRRLAVLHPDPQKQQLARELETRYPPMRDDLFGAPRVMETQQPELVREVPDDMLERAARDSRHLEILRELRMGSYMVLPLVARGRLLGSLTFVAADDETRYTPRDLLFAEDLAARAAVAMDNARLFQEAELARKDAEAALARAAEADRAKADFLTVMSHELHTPLNAISGYAELLEMGVRGPVTEQQREAIARIRQAQQHLLRVVDDLLTFSRAEHGRLPLRIERVDVNEALAGVHYMIEPLIAAAGLDFQSLPCDPPLFAKADRDRLQQIVVNLLSNAAKFSPRGSRVTLQCMREREFVAIRLSDAGPGIPRDKHELIFQPFVQGAGGLTRTVGGSGLGLAISRDLARLMGGDVTLESEPGKGSTFTLCLPASDLPGAAL